MVRSVSARSLVVAALLATTAAFPQAAWAQDVRPADTVEGDSASSMAEDEPEEIVVTGIRQSLEAARDLKRDAVQFVDAIVADDIGKLPDTNVAESLARVSGVQVERGVGEGTDISVRGLRENVVLFNGRQIFDSTGRGGNGLDQLGGSTYGLLTLVPSELISRLEVTKLAGSNQIAGALGGIIDIQTRLPLDGAEQNAAFAGAFTYDELAERPGFELFGLLSERFADDRLGVLVTASYTDRTLEQQGLDTFSGYARFTDTLMTPGRTRFGNADVRAQEIDEHRTKLGLSAVVQWEPTDGVELIADTFYSRLTAERERYWLSFTPTAGLRSAAYSDNDILLSGRSAGPVLSNTEYADVDSEVWSSALRGRFDLSDRLSATGEVSYGTSEASYKQIYFRLQPLATITPIIDFDLTSGSFGSFNIGGVDLTNPAQLRFTILFDQTYRAKTDSLAARTDWKYQIGSSFLDSLEAGARFNRLETVQDPTRADIRPTGGIPASQLAGFVGVRTNADFLPGQFEGLPRSYLVGTPGITGCAAFSAFPSVSSNAACLNPDATVNSIAGTFEVNEDFIEAYGKLNFDVDLGAVGIAGNVGVRYVNRDLTSIGSLVSSTGAATPATFERTDDEWLPSATAKIEVIDGLVLRLGAAKVVAFPNTEDLNNGVTLNNNAVFVEGIQTLPATGAGGAPALDPFRANQFDASIEYYFGEQALVSAGLFYKDVSTFIIQRQSAESYAGINYLINRRVNGDSAEVKGVELLAQLPFYFLPEPLDGFGAVATYSYIDSSTPIQDIGGRNLTFPGLSKNNVNLIGYYERGPLSVRIAYNWRDDFLIGLSAAATGVYNDAYSDLSATVRFDVADTVSLTLEGLNLLDAEQRTYDAVPEALRTNVVFGRIYKATISARF